MKKSRLHVDKESIIRFFNDIAKISSSNNIKIVLIVGHKNFRNSVTLTFHFLNGRKNEIRFSRILLDFYELEKFFINEELVHMIFASVRDYFLESELLKLNKNIYFCYFEDSIFYDLKTKEKSTKMYIKKIKKGDF
jgi:hypothetical protein